jgi:hypothetical protein
VKFLIVLLALLTVCIVFVPSASAAVTNYEYSNTFHLDGWVCPSTVWTNDATGALCGILNPKRTGGGDYCWCDSITGQVNCCEDQAGQYRTCEISGASFDLPASSPTQTVTCTAPEICDDLDNDHINGIDDGDVCCSNIDWYLDSDDDGYGLTSNKITVCHTTDEPGRSIVGGDCDDIDSNIGVATDSTCDGDSDSVIDKTAFVTLTSDSDCSDSDANLKGADDATCDDDGDGFTDITAFVSRIYTDADCRDDLANVNPSQTEDSFSLCRDGLDNQCDGDTDVSDAACQIDCAAGYDELLRFSNVTLADSKVSPPIANDYSHYFPLCIKGANLQVEYSSANDLGDALLPVLKYDATTKLVATNNVAGTPDGTFYMNAQNCYADISCTAPFTAIAALQTNGSYSTLTHPEVTSPQKLCCLLDEQGIIFDNAGTPEKITCNVVSDGICPEDFEDVDGDQVTCTLFEDPDCGGDSKFYEPTAFRSFLGLDFEDRNYLITATNDVGAIVTVKEEISEPNLYTYRLGITSAVHTEESKTDFEFSYAQNPPTVRFDDVAIPECSTPGADPALCYEWNEDTFVLTVYHSLSEHDLEVAFSYTTISLFLLLGILFAALLPIIIIHYSRSGHLGVMIRKKETALTKDIAIARKYVESRLKIGEHPDAIRDTLKNAGWRSHIVEMGIHGVHTKSTVKQLEGYIEACLDLGVKRSDVYAALLSAGWDRTDIDDVFNDIFKSRK